MNTLSQHKLLFGIGLVVALMLIGVGSLKLWQTTRFTFRQSAGADTVYGGSVIKKSDGSVVRQVSKDKPVIGQLSAEETHGSRIVCANLYFADGTEVKLALKTSSGEVSSTVAQAKQSWHDVCVTSESVGEADETGSLTLTATRGSANLYSIYGKR